MSLLEANRQSSFVSTLAGSGLALWIGLMVPAHAQSDEAATVVTLSIIR
jgi:hypothetical protein